jgi:predicted ferric reductase
LAARYRWVEHPFGQDVLYRFHRSMGLLAGFLLLAHPILYAAGGEWELLYSFSGGWEVALGRVASLALLGIILSSVFRTSLRLSFETWRGIHNGFAFSLLLLGFVHSVAAGGDLSDWPMRLVWFGLFAVGFVSYLLHFLSVHRRERETEFEVVRVTQETADVWTLEMKPARPELGIDHLPGQFLFLTLHRDLGPTEEHPFSISSAPSKDGHVTATIKASGDYTRTIGDTEVGHRATVRAPFGRFSHVLDRQDKPLVFIAGGVGVTPMLSMIRHMHAEGSDRSVLLLYGSRTEADIVARAELDQIAASGSPSLRVVHVLGKADDDWQGETGHIDRACIECHCGSLDGRSFYVSGPPLMIDAIVRTLRGAGVPDRDIHFERFSL